MKHRASKKSGIEAQVEPNVTPLADVTMTLIIVFLIAMPALMWSGMRVNPAQATAPDHETVPESEVDGELLVIEVTTSGISVDGRSSTLEALEPAVRAFAERHPDNTVVIVPEDAVLLDVVVSVLDIAKGAGAQKIALLDREAASSVSG